MLYFLPWPRIDPHRLPKGDLCRLLAVLHTVATIASVEHSPPFLKTQWRILLVLTGTVIPPARVLTPLPLSRPLGGPLSQPGSSPWWRQPAFPLPFSVPAHPTSAPSQLLGSGDSTLWSHTGAWEKKERKSIRSVFFFKILTFCSLVIILYSLWFLKKKYCIKESLSLSWVSFWQPLTLCTRSKCLTRLALGPAPWRGPPLLPLGSSCKASGMKAFSAETRLDPILGCLPASAPWASVAMGELLSSAGLGHLVPLEDQGSCAVLFPALHLVPAPERALSPPPPPQNTRAGQWWEPQVTHWDAVIEMRAWRKLRETDRTQVFSSFHCCFALTMSWA